MKRSVGIVVLCGGLSVSAMAFAVGRPLGSAQSQTQTQAQTLMQVQTQTQAPAPTQAQQEQEQDVQIVELTAERFAFTPSEVRAKAGTTLEFRLRSDDTNHGFRILDTDIDIRIPKRGKGVETVRFTPEKPGRYTFECSKLCGAGHSFMRGVIIVAE